MLTSVIFCPVSPDTHTKLFAGDGLHLLCPRRPGCAAELGGRSSLCLPNLACSSQGQGVLSCQLNGWEAPMQKAYTLRKLCFKGRHGYVLTPKVLKKLFHLPGSFP